MRSVCGARVGTLIEETHNVHISASALGLGKKSTHQLISDIYGEMMIVSMVSLAGTCIRRIDYEEIRVMQDFVDTAGRIAAGVA
jgi:hypothetical protein